MRYSQNDEQDHIAAYFGDTAGKLLDIGAADGIQFSNTFHLLQKGWTGVLCEASPGVLPALFRNTERFPVEILAFPIGSKTGVVKWHDCGGDMLSGTSEKNVHLWTEVKFTQNTFMYQMGWRELKERYGDTFDFINIDVEGHSAELFLEMFADFPACKLWCIEHDGRNQEILDRSGMKQIAFNGENIIIGK